MQKHVLMLTASTFILACGAIAASAQQVPDVPMIQQQPKSCSSDRSWSVSYGTLKLRGAALKMISRIMVE